MGNNLKSPFLELPESNTHGFLGDTWLISGVHTKMLFAHNINYAQVLHNSCCMLGVIAIVPRGRD